MLDALNWGSPGWSRLSSVEWPYFDLQSPAWAAMALRNQLFTQALPLEGHKNKEKIILKQSVVGCQASVLFHSPLFHSLPLHSMLLYLITRHFSLCGPIPFELGTFYSMLFWFILSCPIPSHPIWFHSIQILCRTSSCLVQGILLDVTKKARVCECMHTRVFWRVVFRISL